MHGIGVFCWSDGKKYEGSYVYDKKEGYGEFFWPNGNWYKGFWKGGKQNGEGEFFDSVKNKVISGNWVDGEL
jgi:hypothetical protein